MFGHKKKRLGFADVKGWLQMRAQGMHPLQHIRELVENGLTHGQATEIEFTKGHGGRLIYRDNGVGMSSKQLWRYFGDLYSSGTGEVSVTGNKGIGAKVSLLYWCRQVLVISWQNNSGAGVKLFFDDDEQPCIEEIPHEIVALYRKGTSGTVVVADQPDSVNGPNGEVKQAQAAMVKYLNTRYFTLPEGVTVKCLVNEANTTNRFAKGSRYFLDGRSKQNGTVALADDVKVHWWIRDETVGDSSQALNKSFVALRYEDELYETPSDDRAIRRRQFAFGVDEIEVARVVTLVVEPPNRDLDGKAAGTMAADDGRSRISWYRPKSADQELPWDKWGEQFAAVLPEPIAEALKGIRDRQPEINIDEELDDLWKKIRKTIHRPTKKKTDLFGCIDDEMPASPDGDGGAGPGPSPGPKNAPVVTDPDPNCEQPIAPVPPGRPEIRVSWIDGDAVAKDLQPFAAEYHLRNRKVVANRDFEAFVAHRSELEKKYRGRATAAEVRTAFETEYNAVFIGILLHTSVLHSYRTAPEEIQYRMHAPEALTAAVLGRTRDAAIEERIRKIIENRKAVAA